MDALNACMSRAMLESGKRAAADAQSEDNQQRRCVPGCVFAPHFGGRGGREHGSGSAAQFAAVHKVFGASNVAKMLSRVPAAMRSDAASTVCYEAQARVAEPVYGCVGTILALQHQVTHDM
jgi:LOB domain-containing protein 18